MKSIRYMGPDKLEYGDAPDIQLKDGWALIKVSHVGICGSDQTIYHGKHPRAKAPLIFGHEFSGFMAQDAGAYKQGDLVTAYPFLPCGQCEQCKNGQFHVCKSLKIIGIDLDGGMAEYVQVPLDTLYQPPEGCTPVLAAFIEPVSISVHVARKGGYRPGDSVAIFGAGSIGLSTAITLRRFGASCPMIVEPNPERAALAQQMGFDVLDTQKDVIAQIYERTNGDGAQFVYDCAGAQPVIDLLPDAVKIGGVIVMVAGYKDPPRMNFQKGMFREFSIQFVRNSTREDFEIATKLIAMDLGYDKLLNCILPLSEAEAGFDPPASAYKVIFEV